LQILLKSVVNNSIYIDRASGQIRGALSWDDLPDVSKNCSAITPNLPAPPTFIPSESPPSLALGHPHHRYLFNTCLFPTWILFYKKRSYTKNL